MKKGLDCKVCQEYSVWLCGTITWILGLIAGNGIQYGIGLGILFGLLIFVIIRRFVNGGGK